jgi:FkbM family methyltransferase
MGTTPGLDDMTNIFIDCGGHRGQSIKKFIKTNKDFECYTFEPNIAFNKSYENLPTKLMNVAAYTYDGEIDLFLGGKDAQGSTVIDGKLKSASIVRVKCIDLGNWIKTNFDANNYIVLKLNVECAEYAILRHMIDDGSIYYINKLYVEFHYDKYKCGTTKEEYMKLTEELLGIIKIDDWVCREVE